MDCVLSQFVIVDVGGSFSERTSLGGIDFKHRQADRSALRLQDSETCQMPCMNTYTRMQHARL